MLRAIADLRYNSKDLKAGQEFEPISEKDAFVLKAAGKAEEVSEPKQKRRYLRRDMQAQG